MKIIPLTQGKFAMVDDEDYDEVSKFNWCFLAAGGKNGYATRRKYINGKRSMVTMHREIMGSPKNLEIDHRDGDGLDNRKENLRVATTAQNQWNSEIPITNTSGIKGVTWHKPYSKWRSYIRVRGKRLFLGYFAIKEDAARAYAEAANRFHGEFAKPTPT